MPLSYFIITIAIPICWILFAAYKYQKNPKTGFIILCVYIALFKYGQIGQGENEFFRPSEVTGKFEEITDSIQHDYVVNIIKTNEKFYFQINPVFSNPRIAKNFFFFFFFFSEYIFNEIGLLVDWTSDNMDDGPYQDKWERPEVRKEVSKKEAKDMIKNKKITI